MVLSFKVFRDKDSTPVLMLTANSQIDKKGILQKCCIIIEVKPFEPDELLKINKLLNPRFNKNKLKKISYFAISCLIQQQTSELNGFHKFNII